MGSVAPSSSSSVPVYFELSWSILSSIGLANVLFGISVAGISGFPLISLVPLIVSAASAVANGLCYYAFYTDGAVTNMAVASAFADLTWLIQEAGLSFYSYVILTKVLGRRNRIIFIPLFWILIATISALRIAIMIIRIQYILGGSKDAEVLKTINLLHVGYFTSIALVECVSAFFLLRKFHWARWSALNVGLFSYLMRSTEIRLALLAVVGVTRAVTYSFQTTVQSATSVASQLDRFAYTLECMFPVMMLIDILASRLVFAGNSRGEKYNTNNGQSSNHGASRPTDPHDGPFHMVTLRSMKGNTTEVQLERKSSRRSSQEPINLEPPSSSDTVVTCVADRSAGRSPSPPKDMGGINRTVEFHMYEVAENPTRSHQGGDDVWQKR